MDKVDLELEGKSWLSDAQDLVLGGGEITIGRPGCLHLKKGDKVLDL